MVSRSSCNTGEAGEKLDAWIHQGYHLPVHPAVLLKLIQLGKNPEASPEDYAAVISSSNSLSAKILSAVNSSWFGVRQPIKKPLQAVNLLGMVSVRMLAITHALAAFHERLHLPDEILRPYWQAGLIKAESAKYLAEQKAPEVCDEAFLVGLMQDMVMSLMHQLVPDLYEQAVVRQAWTPAALCAREAEVFGVDHAAAAAELGRTIGLPEPICAIIASHHDREALEQVCETRGLAEAVYFSGLFPHMCAAWAPSEASIAAEIIDEAFGAPILGASINQVLVEIERRYRRLSECVRPAAAEEIDLPALLGRATGEVAATATSLVGQVHSLMSNSTQAASRLSAVNAEAIRLQEQTQIDALTGVLNRAGLEKLGPAELDRLRAVGDNVLLIFADLDGFKAINDRHGHDKGDEALQRVARVMREVFGPTAVVGRYGGDEFVILRGEVDSLRTAEAMACDVIEKLRPGLVDDDGAVVPIGVSLGGVWCDVSSPAAPFHKLLVGADEMMYAAKKNDAASVRIRRLAG